MSNPKQKTCFVIRPFNTLYDKRHNKIFVPAIKDAGLSVHLAGGPGVINITKEIEDGISKAHICFADVSENNPNVWYEVGFAFACGRKVAMVCNNEIREIDKLPFDIKVKKVISYNYSVDSESQPAAQFQKEITEHVRELSKISPPSVSQPHVLDKHQVKDPPDFTDEEIERIKRLIDNTPIPSFIPQSLAEGNTSIIPDGLTREDLKILSDIITYCLRRGESMSSRFLKNDGRNSLNVDTSIQKLLNKGYIVLQSYLAREDGYKSTDKALKFFENNRELFDE